MSSDKNDLKDFTKVVADSIQGTAVIGAGSAGFAAGVGMGNSIIAAGFGAACSPFAAVPVLTVGAVYLTFKAFQAIKEKLDIT